MTPRIMAPGRTSPAITLRCDQPAPTSRPARHPDLRSMHRFTGRRDRLIMSPASRPSVADRRNQAPRRFGATPSNRYNGLVPKRGGQLGIGLLLLGLPVLTLGPAEVGTIRLAGVSLVWWYVAVLAPILSVLITLLATLQSRSPRPAADRPSRRHDPATARLGRGALRSARTAPGNAPPGRPPERSGQAAVDIGRAASDTPAPERDRGRSDAGGDGTRRPPARPPDIASSAR